MVALQVTAQDVQRRPDPPAGGRRQPLTSLSDKVSSDVAQPEAWTLAPGESAFPQDFGVWCVARRLHARPARPSNVDGRHFVLPTGCSPVRVDDNKNAERTISDANVTFSQMKCDIRRQLRDRNPATDLATNLHQHLLDAPTQERLHNDCGGFFVQQPALCIRNVQPHLLGRSGVGEMGLHEFVDASLVHR